MSEKPKPEQDAKTGRFVTGNIGGPGRGPTARTRLTNSFIEALEADWIEHGVETIEKVRADRPDTYLKIVADLLPKDVNLNLNENTELSDDQLLARIRRLDAAIGPFLAAADAAGSSNGTGSAKPH